MKELINKILYKLFNKRFLFKDGFYYIGPHIIRWHTGDAIHPDYSHKNKIAYKKYGHFGYSIEWHAFASIDYNMYQLYGTYNKKTGLIYSIGINKDPNNHYYNKEISEKLLKYL